MTLQPGPTPWGLRALCSSCPHFDQVDGSVTTEVVTASTRLLAAQWIGDWQTWHFNHHRSAHQLCALSQVIASLLWAWRACLAQFICVKIQENIFTCSSCTRHIADAVSLLACLSPIFTSSAVPSSSSRPVSDLSRLFMGEEIKRQKAISVFSTGGLKKPWKLKTWISCSLLLAALTSGLNKHDQRTFFFP